MWDRLLAQEAWGQNVYLLFVILLVRFSLGAQWLGRLSVAWVWDIRLREAVLPFTFKVGNSGVFLLMTSLLPKTPMRERSGRS